MTGAGGGEIQFPGYFAARNLEALLCRVSASRQRYETVPVHIWWNGGITPLILNFGDRWNERSF
jgi:hypothetical protein